MSFPLPSKLINETKLDDGARSLNTFNADIMQSIAWEVRQDLGFEIPSKM